MSHGYWRVSLKEIVQFILFTRGSRSPNLFSLRYFLTDFNLRAIKQYWNDCESKAFPGPISPFGGWHKTDSLCFWLWVFFSQFEPVNQPSSWEISEKLIFFCMHWSLRINKTKLKHLPEPIKSVYNLWWKLAYVSAKWDPNFWKSAWDGFRLRFLLSFGRLFLP